MTTINVMALAATAVLYVSVYGATWRDRYYARLTLGCSLALILAVSIQAPLQGRCVVHKTRATVVYYTQSHRYIVTDQWYDTVIIQTTSYVIADYWRLRCNQCRHEIPYDICDHDLRVGRQQLDQIGPAARPRANG